MDKFRNRLKYYLVGFGFGIMAIVFFFGGRGCSWMPSNRIKNVIAENKIILGDSIQDVLNQIAPDSQPIFDLLNKEGDVVFSESDTKSENKTYVINGEDDISVSFKIYDKYSEIVSVSKKGTDYSSSLSNHKKHQLVLPVKIVIQIIESHDFVLYEEAKCQMACYGISQEELDKAHLNVKSFKSSEIDELVNRIFKVTSEIGSKTYTIYYEIGENRTRIKRINGEDTCECE